MKRDVCNVTALQMMSLYLQTIRSNEHQKIMYGKVQRII
jgi:hypothetical protein